MNTINMSDFSSREETTDPLSELLKNGAQALIQQAVECELMALLSKHDERITSQGKKEVVRNGYLPEREIQTGIGPVKVKIPKVRVKSGDSVVFNSTLIPPYVRKSKSLEAALPWLYLKGISSGEMENALQVLVGKEAQGLSASTVAKLKIKWSQDYDQWKKRRFDQDKFVYIWADGIYSRLRKESEKLCCLVIIGVNEYGQKKFLAIEDGVRESTQSWREVLLNLKERGVDAVKLGIGDGACGFWGALSEVYPQAKHQRCWMHKSVNVLNYLPKDVQPKAKEALHNIWMAETKVSAEKAFDLFEKTYQAKYLKAVECLKKDRDSLLSFFEFPAEHWSSIRTSNPIESTFGTIRHRSKRAKGCLSRESMLCMIFKLGECAQAKWRKLRGFEALGKVLTGIKFKDGLEVTKDQGAA